MVPPAEFPYPSSMSMSYRVRTSRCGKRIWRNSTDYLRIIPYIFCLHTFWLWLRSLLPSMVVKQSRHASSVPNSLDSEASNPPLAFVIISHPAARKDAGIQREVRRHAAHSWRGDSLLSKSQMGGLSPVEPKDFKSGENRRRNAFSLVTSYQAKDDVTHSRQSKNPPSVASSKGITGPPLQSLAQVQ
jgi:hypothetical protein